MASIGALATAYLAIALPAAPTAPPRDHIDVDDASWHLESSSDGITLYSSPHPDVGVVPLKVVMTIPGTIEDVALVLEDLSRRRDWISNFGLSVLLERPNDYDQTEYLRVHLPWPVEDRSAVVRVQVSVSDDLRRALIAGESVETPLADRLPRLVRAQVHASTFQMTQVENRVEVVGLVFIDPRGGVPKWIVNYFTRRGARTTLAGLRRQVARKLYSPSQIMAMHRRMEGYRVFRERGASVPQAPMAPVTPMRPHSCPAWLPSSPGPRAARCAARATMAA
jgi:hypothetical protein